MLPRIFSQIFVQVDYNKGDEFMKNNTAILHIAYFQEYHPTSILCKQIAVKKGGKVCNKKPVCLKDFLGRLCYQKEFCMPFKHGHVYKYMHGII